MILGTDRGDLSGVPPLAGAPNKTESTGAGRPANESFKAAVT